MVPLDQTEVAPGVYYVNHPHHRDPAQRDKSQWTISRDDERDVFRLTVTRRWYLSPTGWGLHLPNGVAAYLGHARDLTDTGREARRLFVAKFIQDMGNTVWHGYPADHQRHAANVPPESLLKSWAEAGFLRWSTISKVLRGKPCSL